MDSMKMDKGQGDYVEALEKEKPVEAVQKGFSFLQERMLTDQSLLGYLSDCSALPDEIKQGMKEGQDFVSSGRAIKAILRHGLEECRKLIDFIRSSQLHAEFKEYLSKVDVDSEKFDLSIKTVCEHRATLHEEMEPSLIADVLLEKLVLNIDEHDTVERAVTRKEKCIALLKLLVEKHKDDIQKFKCALRKCGCSSALDEMKEKESEMPANALDCVTRTYRLLHQKIQRDYLYECFKEGERGCRALLNNIREENLSFFYEVMEKYKQYDKTAGGPAECTIDIGSVLCELDFLKKEMEPIPFSDVLLEKKLISPSLHQSVHQESSRKIQADKILEELQKIYEKKYDDAEEKWERHMYDVYQKQEMTGHKHKPPTFRPENLPFDTKALEKDFKAPDIEYCISQLKWTAVLEKLKEKGSVFKDCVSHSYTLSNYDEEKFVLKRQSMAFNEGMIPSAMVLSIEIRNSKMDLKERQQEMVKFLNSDTTLRSRISRFLHMRVDKAESPLVLHLTSLTEEASQRLLSDNDHVVQKLIKILLDMMNISISLYEESKTLEIHVTITESTSGSNKKEDSHFIKVKIQQHWDLLVQELEPCQLLMCFVKEGLMTKPEEQIIRSCRQRQTMVAAFLKILLKASEERTFEYFVQLLRQLNKKDIADKLYCRDMINVHQDAEAARQNILLHLDEVLENTDTYITEQTLRKRDDSIIPESVWPKSGFSQKGRAYSLLLFVFEDDSLVLEFKNALECRRFGHYFQNIIADTTDVLQEKNEEGMQKKLTGNTLFECTYRTGFRAGYDPAARHKEIVPVVSHDYYYDERYRRGRRLWHMEELCHPDMFYRRMEMMRRPMRRHLGMTSKPATNEPEEKKKFVKKYKTVAAIDFGTSYSGFAFSSQENPLEVVTGKWKTNSSELLESLKTPTSLLFKKNGLVEDFGYKAEQKFKALVEENKHHDYRFFNRLKTELLKKHQCDDDIVVFDHMNKPMDALKVFSHAIGFLIVDCRTAMEEKKIDKEDVLWVMTVPSLWDNFAKQFLRKAAKEAGIPSQQLILTLEPEVAAIYTIRGSKPDLASGSQDQYASGTQILLVDLGGGTADFSLMGVAKDGGLEVLHEAVGGAWGGTTINARIWDFLEELLTKDVIDEFRKQTSDYLEMESNIELKKRDLSADNKLLLLVYPSLASICKDKTGKTYKELVEESVHAEDVKVRTGKIIFEPKMIEKIFERTLKECFSVMDEILKNNGKDVKDIILVGGFSESEIIQKQFQKKYSKYRLMIPTDPGLAVLKGAVIFGHDDTMVKRRISPHTYGVETLQFGFDTDPDDMKKVISGTAFCSGTFHKIVSRGEILQVAQTTDVDVFSPKISARQLFLRFYQTDKEGIKCVTDEGCEYIGKLTINIPEPPLGVEPLVRLSFNFGEIEITVEGKEVLMDKPVETTIDFLERKP